MSKWYLLYSTKNLSEANIIKGMLEENSIVVMLVNKQDSSYLNFGEIELFVPDHLKNIAIHLLNQGLMN